MAPLADAETVTSTGTEATGSPEEEMTVLRARLAVLEQGTQRPKRRRLPRVLAITSAVAAGLVLLTVGDWFQQNREMNALLSAAEQHDAAVEVWGKSNAAVAEPTAGVGTYQREQQQSDYRAAMGAVAQREAPAVSAAGRAVARVDVLPWHRDIVQARGATEDYTTALDALFSGLAQEKQDLRPELLALNSANEAVTAPMRDAVPGFPLYDLRQRAEDYTPAD